MDPVPVGKIGNKNTIVRASALAVIVCLCLLIGIAHAAMAGEADLFETAYGFYQSGEHGKAAGLFGTFLKEYPDSSLRDSALFWQARAYIRLGSPDRAKALLDTLIAQNPQSIFNGFARQELEVMKQTASSGPIAGTQTVPERVYDSCAEDLKKADDRFRSLKDQLSDSYTRNQFLENELTAVTRDKQYLSSVIEELKQTGQGTSNSAAELGVLKAENGRLQQEVRSLSSGYEKRQAELAAALKDNEETIVRLRREREDVIKFLTIDEFISRKIREQAVDEAQVRTYYENNKHLYPTKKAEKMVTALMLPYTPGTQFEGAVLMTEIQAEASGGKSLDVLHQAGSGRLTLKQLRYRDLPAWIQENLQDLKDGATSSVISTDDQYMIYQTWYSKSSVREFEEVKEAIRNFLAVSEVLGPWLSKIRKEAEEVR